MALRLLGTTLSAQRPLTPRELAAKAAACLSAGDLDGYAALFASAGELTGEFDALHAHLLLVEEGLTATGAGNPQASRVYLAAACGLVDALERNPREPRLLNYAGVAFYELWSLDAARDLFKAAHRLDPDLPHLRRNLSEVTRRLRDGQGAAARRRPLFTALPALARRAKRVAAQARPATGLTLSLCMIVRDEEEMLPRCLAAAAPAVDEIIVVDTGSQDRTVEIARSFGATVIEREWTGSFSDARNVSFEAATSDWVIYLDADEVLVADDVAKLRALTGQVWREAFYLLETSYTGEEGDGTGVVHNTLRMFRNRSDYRFEGRLHEQIAHHLPTYLPGRIEHTSVRLEHYGYLGSVRDAKEKSRRNIELLRAQQSEGTANSFLHFNLGIEYSAVGDAAAAVTELERAWELVVAGGEQGRDFVPALVVRLVSSLHACGRDADSLRMAQDGLQLFPRFTDLVFAQGWALLGLGRTDEAEAAWLKCLKMGDAPARYGASVGAGTYLPMMALANLYAGRGEPDRARTLLERVMSEHPGFVGAAGPYALTLLRTGESPEHVVAEIERRVPRLTPSVRAVLASALLAHGALRAAAEQYRLILESRASSTHVRVTLAETLLKLKELGEAAELARAVSDDDPFAALAARIELWAIIAADGLDGLPAAEARAARVGVSAAELDVFARWAAVTRGQVPAGALAVAGAPLLGVILESLLAGHEFLAFERLVPVLVQSGLPRREQRELLAGMYLRHGFLQSAAQEWMAVAQEAPDARALLGLARVAAAHGAHEEARTFAENAAALDPANVAARDLLIGLRPESLAGVA